MANEYAKAVAEETVKRVSPTTYDYTPPAVRGVPHLAIPGLHTFLDSMVDGLERLRRSAKIENRTVDSLQALPSLWNSPGRKRVGRALQAGTRAPAG